MFYICDKKVNNSEIVYGIKDTSDNVVEYYTVNQVIDICKNSNITINGVLKLQDGKYRIGVFQPNNTGKVINVYLMGFAGVSFLNMVLCSNDITQLDLDDTLKSFRLFSENESILDYDVIENYKSHTIAWEPGKAKIIEVLEYLISSNYKLLVSLPNKDICYDYCYGCDCFDEDDNYNYSKKSLFNSNFKEFRNSLKSLGLKIVSRDSI